MPPRDPADSTEADDFTSIPALDDALACAFGPRESRSPASPTGSGARETPEAPVDRHVVVRALEERGRYRIAGVLGRGGMGIVLRAEDALAGRQVAIKILPELAPSRRVEAASLFLEEARTAARLEHPGIVPLYDLGVIDGTWPWYSMRLVEGETLAGRFAARPDGAPRGDDEFLTTFRRIAEAVAWAHERGVVHCDLKPSNILLGAHGEVFVTDWGLAGLARSGGGEYRHRSGMRFGTPSCMAPEQARGELDRLGPRTDAFALGALLVEGLTGVAVYAGASREECLRAAAAGELEPALARLAACAADEELKAIARACLATDPTDRPAHAGEIVERVARHGAEVRARLRASEIRLVEAEERARHARRTRVLLASLLAASLLAAAGFAWALAANAARRQDQDRARDERLAALVDVLAKAEAVLQSDPAGGAEGAGGVEALGRAQADAQRAAEWAARDGIPEALRVRAEGVRKDVEARAEEVARRSRGRQFAEALQKLRDDAAGAWSFVELDRAYAAVFRDHVCDVDGDVPRAAAELAASPWRETALSGLHDWLLVRWGKTGIADEDCRRLAAVLAASETDERRRRVIAALVEPRAEAGAEAFALGLEVLPPTTLHLLAHALAANGPPDGALEAYRRAVLRHPGSYWLHFGLAFQASERTPALLEEARRHYSIAAALEPASARAIVNAGVVSARMEDWTGAEPLLERALELDPGSWRAHYNLGLVRRAQGRLGEAVEEFAAVVERLPEARKALFGLAADAEKRSDRGVAVAALRALFEGGTASVASRLGVLLFDDGRIAAADAPLALRAMRAAVEGEASAQNHFNLAHLLRRLAEFEEACEHFESALAVEPEGSAFHARIEASLATARRESGRWNRVIAVISGEERPDGVQAWKDLIAFAAGFRRHREEAALWRRGFAQEPPVFQDPEGRDRAHAARTLLRLIDLPDPEARSAAGPASARESLLAEAIAHLEAGLAMLTTSLESGRTDAASARRLLEHWCAEPEFAVLAKPAGAIGDSALAARLERLRASVASLRELAGGR